MSNLAIYHFLPILLTMCAQTCKYNERREYKNPYWVGRTVHISSYPLHSVTGLLLHYDLNQLIMGTLGWSCCFSFTGISMIFQWYNGAEIRAQKRKL